MSDLMGVGGLQTVVLNVAMTCKGCSGAVKRVLDKMEGSFFLFIVLFCFLKEPHILFLHLPSHTFI